MDWWIDDSLPVGPDKDGPEKKFDGQPVGMITAGPLSGQYVYELDNGQWALQNDTPLRSGDSFTLTVSYTLGTN